jgi:tetratricopeptide (TPR) repeat protein
MKTVAWAAVAVALLASPAHANEGEILGLVQAAEAALAAGRNPQALQKLERAAALARESGAPTLVPAIEASLGNAYLLSGRPGDAERMLRSAVDRARRANSSVGRSRRDADGHRSSA